MSCFASRCAIVVLVKRLWIVIHTARRSGPQSWGGRALNPLHAPRCGISEQTAVYERDGLGAVGHHNPGHRGLAASPHAHRSSGSSKNLTITTLDPIPSPYLPKSQNLDGKGDQLSFIMLVLCAAPAHCPFLHLQLARSLCSIMYSTLPVLGLPTSIQTHEPPEHRAMNEAVARIIY